MEMNPARPLAATERAAIQRMPNKVNEFRLPLTGRAQTILAARDAKLAAAREARRAERQQERIPAQTADGI